MYPDAHLIDESKINSHTLICMAVDVVDEVQDQVETHNIQDQVEVQNFNFSTDFYDNNQREVQDQGDVDLNFDFLNDYYINQDLESDEDEVFRKKLAEWAKETNTTLLAVTKL